MSPTLDPHAFLGVQAPLSKARALILPIPYEQTTTFLTGTREGPRALIAASREVELYDEELDWEPATVGIHTLPAVEPVMEGPRTMVEQIHRAALPHVKAGRFLIGLGGEHTVSLGLVRAYKVLHPRFTVVQLDAHADLRESYQKTKFSHACVMRRIWELVPILPIGLRSLSREEARFIQEHELRVFFARDLRTRRHWMEETLDLMEETVYLTLDLDSLDPSIMPSVGTPEPDGLTWRETVSFLKLLCERRTVIGADVVELSPRPGHPASDFLAARLIYKLIGYRFREEKKK